MSQRGSDVSLWWCAQKEEIVEVAQSVFGTIDRHAAEELPHSFAYVATEKLRQEAGQ